MNNAIVELFKQSGMSIAEFARRTDLKYSTAHDIVTGKSDIEKIGAGVFVRIAHVLNTTADALIDGVVDSRDADDELTMINELLSAEGQQQLLIFARGLLATYPKNNQVSKTA